jgi:hypothetical protein
LKRSCLLGTDQRTGCQATGRADGGSVGTGHGADFRAMVRPGQSAGGRAGTAAQSHRTGHAAGRGLITAHAGGGSRILAALAVFRDELVERLARGRHHRYRRAHRFGGTSRQQGGQ